MGLSLLIQNVAAAFSVGLGCGTCCGASAGVFLTSYTMTHANNIKKALFTFLMFFLGKLLAVILVCAGASILGNKFINENGYIGKMNFDKALQIGLIIVGLALIVNWIYKYFQEKKSCKECKGKCHEHNFDEEKLKKWPPLVIGFVYGISPCAPLILIAGYSAAMSIMGATIIGAAFAISSSISPLIVMVLIAGILSQKMYEEIPKWIDVARLSSYVLFVAMAIIMI